MWQNSNCDKTQKLILWQNLQIQIVTKLEWWQISIYKRTKTLRGSFSKNILTPWQPMRCSLGSVLRFSKCFFLPRGRGGGRGYVLVWMVILEGQQRPNVTIREGGKKKHHWICDHDHTRQGGSAGGDHTLLGFFFSMLQT